MMQRLILALALAPGCGGSGSGPVPETITDGVSVNLPGCPFTSTTPPSTTTPFADDPSYSIGTPRALHLSWAGDPSTSVSMLWESEIAARATRVEYGIGDYGKAASGFTFAYPTDLAGGDPPSVRVHELHLCGLLPGTAYQYRIAGTSMGGNFATAPAAGKPIHFAVGGDSRGNAAQWGQVLADAGPRGLDFFVYTGDAVTLGSIQSNWDDWFVAGKNVLPSLPLQFAEGNHEINTRHYFAQFALPKNEQWYDFDYGDVHFVVLDDTPAIDSSIEGDQAKFLDASLGGSQKKWKVVIHHKAIYSSSTHGSQTRLQAAWMGSYDNYHVDAVFNGHDHDYERSKSMKAGAPVADGVGTVYIVNGGGGADPYPAGTGPSTAFSKTSYGYSIVDVTDGKMTITAYTVGGGPATQLDQVVLAK